MAVGEQFRSFSADQLLEPYTDSKGLVAGYRVDRSLGRDEWRHSTYAASAPDGRRVALKLLDIGFAEDRRAMRRYGRRIRLRASIEHPHMLPIVDWGKVRDRPYLAMALCEAPTLADLLETAPLEPGRLVRLLAQVADAVEVAHGRGLVHRDLTPQRIFVERRDRGHVMLGDFGAADPEWDSHLLDLPGTTPYLSPESLRGEPLAPESNVYSLACMLVEGISGRPPYVSEHEGGVVYAHMAEPPPGVSSRRPGLPASIDEVVAAAMAKDPAERLASPRHMVTAAAISLGERIPAPLREGARPTPARRRPSFSLPRLPALRNQALTAAVVAGVALAATLGFLLARSGSDTVGVESSGAVAAQREQAALRRQAGALLERLDARRVPLRRNLAAARTRGGQLAEARRVQETYRTAADALPRGSAPAAIVGPALSGAERAYARLGAAIRSGDRDEYADAGAAVLQAEEAIEGAIARLNRGGA